MNTARYNTASHLFFKKGVEMAFNHSIIQSFNHSIIQSFYHSIILSFKQPSNQATKQPSNQATKQPSNQATKQRYHTFIAFTKTDLKIPYFLLFPLLLTLLFPLSLIRATTFLNHLIP
ncbi:PT domain-containing protein [Helicobacter pylori]|nr:PT domain-containing protein [Helicobacter pylori]